MPWINDTTVAASKQINARSSVPLSKSTAEYKALQIRPYSR